MLGQHRGGNSTDLDHGSELFILSLNLHYPLSHLTGRWGHSGNSLYHPMILVTARLTVDIVIKEREDVVFKKEEAGLDGLLA